MNFLFFMSCRFGMNNLHKKGTERLYEWNIIHGKASVNTATAKVYLKKWNYTIKGALNPLFYALWKGQKTLPFSMSIRYLFPITMTAEPCIPNYLTNKPLRTQLRSVQCQPLSQAPLSPNEGWCIMKAAYTLLSTMHFWVMLVRTYTSSREHKL